VSPRKLAVPKMLPTKILYAFLVSTNTYTYKVSKVVTVAGTNSNGVHVLV
jgi:hypothetical protein